jgi:putative FmdB family regulatory protein
MPIYEYLCSDCGHRCDILQKISEPLKTQCPECHKETFKKQVSAPSFQLKGTGWYVTDFRDKDKKIPEARKNTTTETKKEAPSKKDTSDKAE